MTVSPVSAWLWQGFRLGLLASRPRIVRTGPLVIDLDDPQRVTVDGRLIHLSGREWGILAYLAEHVGQACHADAIVGAAWGPAWVPARPYTRSDGTRRSADRRPLSVTLWRLRRKLGPAARLVTASGDSWHPSRRLELEEPI